jgi:predicted XRE-type DNA-binding protein
MKKRLGSAHLWNTQGETPAETARLIVRAQLMTQIADIIKANGWNQTEAAKHCGTEQPRINYLLRGRIDRFTLDSLVNLVTALGRKVRIEIEPL